MVSPVGHFAKKLCEAICLCLERGITGKGGIEIDFVQLFEPHSILDEVWTAAQLIDKPRLTSSVTSIEDCEFIVFDHYMSLDYKVSQRPRFSSQGRLTEHDRSRAVVRV